MGRRDSFRGFRVCDSKITTQTISTRQKMSAITRGHSCILCQRRKVRCDKQKPCGNCAKANAECTVIPQQPRGKRNLAKLHGKDLLERLKRYEELMTKNGIEFGSIAHGGEDYGEPETPNNEKPFPNQNARGQSSARTNEERQGSLRG